MKACITKGFNVVNKMDFNIKVKRGFIKPVKHSKCRKGNIESSCCYGIEVDDDAGLAVALGFKNGTLSKVDYAVDTGNIVQLIELTCLIEKAEECSSSEDRFIAELDESIRDSRKSQKKARKRAWQPEISEFNNKWSGSIAIIERMLRKLSVNHDPEYELLIVVKNSTSAKIMGILSDKLATYLSGMMGEVKVIKTDDLVDHIIQIPITPFIPLPIAKAPRI